MDTTRRKGIGASTVGLLYHAGGRIVFGDVNTSAAQSLIASLPPPAAKPIFVHCDVTNYVGNLALFKTALETYER